MRKAIIIGLALALLVGVTSAPAVAKKKKKAKPVVTTLYLHGNAALGELDIPDALDGMYMVMDPAEPEGQPKSMTMAMITAVAATSPNPQCAGSPLFPVWVGDVEGKIVGDMTFTFHTLSSPTSVDVRVWPDVGSLACNESYPTPAAEVTVDVPPGHGEVEAVLEGVKFDAVRRIMVQITPSASPPPTLGRVFYDSPDFASSLEFKCIPAKGKSCTP